MNEKLLILNYNPFELTQAEKEKVFWAEMKSAVMRHYQNCPEFARLCDNRKFNPRENYALADIPYFPVSLFKSFDLLSVSKEKIVKTLYSSSTSGKSSKIMLDKVTSNNQTIALNKILTDFLGGDRRHFIIFDAEETIKSANGELSSRGAAIRGMLSMAKKISFVLDKNLNLDVDKLKKIVSRIAPKEKICYFGFTWLIYNIYSNNKDNEEIMKIFARVGSRDKLVLHIGGWKKLKDIAVSKENFNKGVGKMLRVGKNKVVDFYGMTEQLGTVYPDCEYGYKHLPVYSEIIIRDINTLKPVADNKVGFIQLISPIPQSYPGISILSEDLGRIVGVDSCKCGRKGKYFVFEKRSEKAELKGCGDTLKV